MAEGFFERWSRRKQQERSERAPDEAQPDARSPVSPAAPAALAAASQPPSAGAPAGEDASARAGSVGPSGDTPPLTLDDVQSLTAESDFKPFVARGIAPEVRNAAFRKLFADPQFNVMDGLDIYIDDYSVSTPIPEATLRQMASARFLNLFDEDPVENPGAAAPGVVAQSDPAAAVAAAPAPAAAPADAADSPSSPPAAHLPPASPTNDDHHADLRLQQDHAPGADGAGRGAV